MADTRIWPIWPEALFVHAGFSLSLDTRGNALIEIASPYRIQEPGAYVPPVDSLEVKVRVRLSKNSQDCPGLSSGMAPRTVMTGTYLHHQASPPSLDDHGFSAGMSQQLGIKVHTVPH
jgi:hypothetical protein